MRPASFPILRKSAKARAFSPGCREGVEGRVAELEELEGVLEFEADGVDREVAEDEGGGGVGGEDSEGWEDKGGVKLALCVTSLKGSSVCFPASTAFFVSQTCLFLRSLY